MKKTTNRIKNVTELIVAGISLLLILGLTWGLWIAEAIGINSKLRLIIMLAYFITNVVLACIFQERLNSKLIQITCVEAIQLVPAYIIASIASVFS